MMSYGKLSSKNNNEYEIRRIRKDRINFKFILSFL